MKVGNGIPVAPDDFSQGMNCTLEYDILGLIPISIYFIYNSLQAIIIFLLLAIVISLVVFIIAFIYAQQHRKNRRQRLTTALINPDENV